jgi:hypothetical protein
VVAGAALGIGASGCVFSSKAKDWNQLRGLDGKPTYYINTTKIGFNLAVFVPFLGDMGIGGLVRDLSEAVKEEGGNQIRIVQGGSENYWYGWPPFTWILTPVISTVAAEYEPKASTYGKEQAEIAKQKAEGGDARWYMPWSW